MPENTVNEGDVGLGTSNSSEPEVKVSGTGGEHDLYAIMVDGEEKNVSLDELRNGYQRQSDYTKKTQALAAERDRLAQAESIIHALETDPQGTLKTLGEAFGFEDTSGLSHASEMTDIDPDEARIRKIEQTIDNQQKTFRQQELQKELSTLRDKYGDIDENLLFNHAIKSNIGNLETAYKDMTYSNLVEKLSTKTTEDDIVAQKREASVISEGGSTSGTVEPKSSEKVGSIRDAFLLAKEQLQNS